MCDTCTANAAQREAQAAEQARAGEATRRANMAQEFLAASRNKMRSSMDAGLPVWVYKTSHIQVDAQMDAVNDPISLNMRDLNEAGWSGWEIVAVVPRTYSGTQAYQATSSMTMRDWGGQKTEQRVGLSGNVIGVYVVQRLRVTAESLAVMSEEIDQIILENAPG